MRVLILSPGTRGDVAPATGLGAAFVADGHRVTIVANAEYESLVTRAGCSLAHPAERPRDWRPLAETEDLPSLTPAAQQLIEQFRLHAFARGWKTDAVYEVSRSLRLLLGWVGIDAPIPERDIRSLPTMVDNTTAQRVLLFLDQHGLVAPDPERLIDPHQRWIETKIAALPEEIADELRRWVRVLRGEGRRPHPARSFEVIEHYERVKRHAHLRKCCSVGSGMPCDIPE